MSAAEGVPLTRELLEALRRDAEVRFRLADKGSDEEAAAFALVGKCMVLLDRPAALASDAGTVLFDAPDSVRPAPNRTDGVEQKAAPDAELDRLLDAMEFWCEDDDRRSKRRKAVHAHVAQVKREAVEQALHTAASTRSCNFVPAPAPDAALVQKCGACGHDRVAHRGRTGQCIGIVAPDSLPCYCREFVAESSDAPAPAPAPGDASGETDLDFESWLDLYSNAWLNYGRDPVNATDGGYDYGHRSAMRSALLRLYRAATGEVVGTAVLHRTRPSGVNHGCELFSFEFAAGVEMAHGQRHAVSLVLRRDKEGV